MERRRGKRESGEDRWEQSNSQILLKEKEYSGMFP
jgi:hypothetical protein